MAREKKVKNKISVGSRTFDIVLAIFMIFLCVIFLYPFLNVIAVSLSSNSMITTGQITFFPREASFESYKVLFEAENILRAYGNTIIIAAATTVLSIVLNSLVAYVLMVPEFTLKKPLSVIILITMFFSGGTVPTYLTIQNLGLLNSWWALILPSAVSAYNIFLYRAFFKGISPEIREAAKIDGAGELTILFRIYAPLSKALYATFGLFTVVGVWNDYYKALLYLKDADKQPIQMILRKIVFTFSTTSMGEAQQMISQGKLNQLSVQYACIIVAIAPIIIIYPFVQKYFAQGMQMGAVKG